MYIHLYMHRQIHGALADGSPLWLSRVTYTFIYISTFTDIPQQQCSGVATGSQTVGSTPEPKPCCRCQCRAGDQEHLTTGLYEHRLELLKKKWLICTLLLCYVVTDTCASTQRGKAVNPQV